MITPKAVDLKIHLRQGFLEVTFMAEHLICAGWVGRDRQALQAHIDELGQLGVPTPRRVPIYMNLSTYLLTTDDEITVISDKTSGEVEYVLLLNGDDMWVTVGSDQTDRDIETKSIPASKQMYAKCIASECWSYRDLKGHWDDLVLRCWVSKGETKTLYQESALATILAPQELMRELYTDGMVEKRGIVLFSGTIATTTGLVYGDAYELELEDPVLNRKIQHGYTVRVLHQHI